MSPTTLLDESTFFRDITAKPDVDGHQCSGEHHDHHDHPDHIHEDSCSHNHLKPEDLIGKDGRSLRRAFTFGAVGSFALAAANYYGAEEHGSTIMESAFAHEIGDGFTNLARLSAAYYIAKGNDLVKRIAQGAAGTLVAASGLMVGKHVYDKVIDVYHNPSEAFETNIAAGLIGAANLAVNLAMSAVLVRAAIGTDHEHETVPHSYNDVGEAASSGPMLLIPGGEIFGGIGALNAGFRNTYDGTKNAWNAAFNPNAKPSHSCGSKELNYDSNYAAIRGLKRIINPIIGEKRKVFDDTAKYAVDKTIEVYDKITAREPKQHFSLNARLGAKATNLSMIASEKLSNLTSKESTRSKNKSILALGGLAAAAAVVFAENRFNLGISDFVNDLGDSTDSATSSNSYRSPSEINVTEQVQNINPPESPQPRPVDQIYNPQPTQKAPNVEAPLIEFESLEVIAEESVPDIESDSDFIEDTVSVEQPEGTPKYTEYLGTYDSASGEGTVWNISRNQLTELGELNPTDSQVHKVTQLILNENGISWEQAKLLQPGSSIVVPSSSNILAATQM